MFMEIIVTYGMDVHHLFIACLSGLLACMYLQRDKGYGVCCKVEHDISLWKMKGSFVA